MPLRKNLQRYLQKHYRETLAREQSLAAALVKVYEEARKDLYLRFLEVQGSNKTLELQYLSGTLKDIDRRLDYYTNLTAREREEAIQGAHMMGQQLVSDALNAAGVNVGASVGIGLINKGMIEALIGNIPQLAGRVQKDILVKIQDQLTKGALMGESIPKLARRVFGTGLTIEGLKKPMSLQNRSTLIARTEILKASDMGYEDMVVAAQPQASEEILDAWITAGDDRVDPECRAIANGSDPRFKSVKGYPGVYRRENGPRPIIHTHTQCRCRRIPFMISWDKSGALKLSELKGHEAPEKQESSDKNSEKLYNSVKKTPQKSFAEILKEKEREIAPRDTEKGYLFGTNGKIILEKVGAKDHINFTQEEVKLFENNIFTHNHPRGSSLSPEDVAFASSRNLQEIRAVGTEHRYSMSRPVNGWSRDFWSSKIEPVMRKYNQEVENEFYSKIRAGQITVEQANKLHWHEVWSRVARELSLEYKQESW